MVATQALGGVRLPCASACHRVQAKGASAAVARTSPRRAAARLAVRVRAVSGEEAGEVAAALNGVHAQHTPPAAFHLPQLAWPGKGKPHPHRAALALALACALSCVLAPSALAASDASASLISQAISICLHLPVHLNAIVSAYGARTYALLFAIVFCETGLVVTPFLPGDSLLFAAGALAALGSLSLPLLMALLFAAAVLGDGVNYAAGKWLGAQAFSRYSSVFKPEYLAKTQAFFAKYGAKTVRRAPRTAQRTPDAASSQIVLARFVPIIRTFAPFVAGVGSMPFSTFALYNVAGAAVWVGSLTSAGFALGKVPMVKDNFALVTVAIILVSLLPVAWEVWEAKRSGHAA